MRETKQKVTRINIIMKDRRENDNIKLVHIHLRGGCEGPRGHTPVTVVGEAGEPWGP